MNIEVTSLDGGKAGSIKLSDAIFAVDVRPDIIQRMVVYQLAKRRQGSHSVKTRSEITGSGAKIHSQKKTGRARHGDRKAPQFRGGGKPFGPSPRDYSIKLPKKIRAFALKSALSSKVKTKKLIVLDKAEATGKTAELKRQLKNLGIDKALIIDGLTVDQGLSRAIANIPCIDLLPVQGINVYDILRRDTLVLTKTAINELETRYGG